MACGGTFSTAREIFLGQNLEKQMGHPFQPFRIEDGNIAYLDSVGRIHCYLGGAPFVKDRDVWPFTINDDMSTINLEGYPRMNCQSRHILQRGFRTNSGHRLSLNSNQLCELSKNTCLFRRIDWAHTCHQCSNSILNFKP